MGVNAANEYLPQEPVTPFGKALKATANVVAPLAGGIGATTLHGAVEGIAGLIRNLATRAATSAPRETPLNPRTKAPYSNADVDRAAVQLQAGATGAPRAVVQDIRENAVRTTCPKVYGQFAATRAGRECTKVADKLADLDCYEPIAV